MDFNFIDINSKQTDGVEEGEDDDERDQFNEGNAMAVDPLSMDNAALSTDNPEIKGEYEELILKCEPIDYDNEDQDDDREESRSHDGISLLPENDESRSNDGSAILPENDQSRSSLNNMQYNNIKMLEIKGKVKVAHCKRLEELQEGTELVIIAIKQVYCRNKSRYILQFENVEALYVSNYWLEEEFDNPNIDLNYRIKIKLEVLKYTPNRNKERVTFCI
ncbi:uncharacterized protein LOC120352720 isoform X4 [Nilaparvata lugens]|uniref:uncharacterized protein LOC120352720 isoform X4 n=1 Tax=Nilaparvata lugens TaxID=108931 RepID=UPI00193E0EF2|nr:uncharacterized protein LOC120352720 isoform X4 [Nilaparvata lugens]XP_039290594.1 uncharacterized protein LOC120352720 isoform X4 [Nilaparvata lugens]